LGNSIPSFCPILLRLQVRLNPIGEDSPLLRLLCRRDILFISEVSTVSEQSIQNIQYVAAIRF
jgi:hypothetical protein